MDPAAFHPLAQFATLADVTYPDGEGQLLAVVILAVVQGLTEFLPVSSSGHLVLGREALGLHAIEGAVITIALHVGTLIAVLAVYGRDLLGVLRDAISGRPRDLGMILLGSVPAAVVGIGAGDALDGIFDSPVLAASGLLVTALILITGDVFRKRRELIGMPEEELGLNVGVWAALFIGTFQALAILPGISRSGATICAALMVGLSAPRAARYSFLLSLVSVGGAALLEFSDVEQIDGRTMIDLGIGVAVSAAVGLLALRLLLVALRRGSFPWFAAYCATISALWFALG
ncbi:undecaprenyl-diphosphate phosphatase [Engelhardtia mirabilis]|uniref:Undecaprenyl-diphosphatase n=1 Tax=Engelhardtia mirabilis TaxID=2528011 RepID=A0A518BKA0_9BACT|nr:Undecaprenyl-diphosphatase [Planctomycetes bacterium Pla133]QDV01725.1 Undecaprenyl-diphosphatase [Planctomycetes bacterium Pla86]